MQQVLRGVPSPPARTDPRSVRTRRALRDALAAEILSTGDLSQVTVTAVSNRAGVTRRTFYSHFKDIPDLVDQVERETVDGSRALVERIASTHLDELQRSIENLKPCPGSVELLGQNLADLGDARLSRLRCDAIGFIPQGPSALPGLTVLENVLLPFVLWPHGGDGEGAARLLLSRFGIEGLADAYPEDLSGGELRRALIARALVNRPSIVIADEPTSDLDAVSRRGVMECLAAL